MDDTALAAAVRSVRHSRGWRQADLAARANVSRSLVSHLESGRFDNLSLRAIRAVAAALQIRLGWDAGYRGSELSRLRDADHAALGEHLARRLQLDSWSTAAEVSFNHYGERGRIDLVAHHRAAGVLAAFELKTLIVDVQDVLGSLDAKARVARILAPQLGWPSARAVPILVVREGGRIDVASLSIGTYSRACRFAEELHPSGCAVRRRFRAVCS